MDLKVKSEELQVLLTDFIKGEASNDELQSFAWDVIDHFTNSSSDRLPAEEEFEKSFWYAIWQVQHLCDDDHVNDGTTKREILTTLAYMKGEKEIPESCVGQRP